MKGFFFVFSSITPQKECRPCAQDSKCKSAHRKQAKKKSKKIFFKKSLLSM
jgi:hypothetical protein